MSVDTRERQGYDYCVVCDRPKKPRGRSAPLGMGTSLCDDDCNGYRLPPGPDCRWPGEVSCGPGCSFNAVSAENGQRVIPDSDPREKLLAWIDEWLAANNPKRAGYVPAFTLVLTALRGEVERHGQVPPLPGTHNECASCGWASGREECPALRRLASALLGE